MNDSCSDPRPPPAGMLAHLVRSIRPDRARRMAPNGRIDTAVIGLGAQGTRHARLMREYGTSVTAAVALEQAGMVVHESIPVFRSVGEMMSAFPDIAVASIWRHYSTAAGAAIETIEAGIPVVVVITEGIPVRDVRDILAAARANGTLVLGPNTPGIIFPHERVKVGMLPDVFYPAEPEPERFTARGVTVCSRSGAILYHMSDALASVGIAQNGVIGVGGDPAVGTPFKDIVPLAMGFPGTDLVVVAGEIGGIQEESLARDVREHPERYPKPLIALISGRCAPEGKTMGHAGAIVSPGTEYGTWSSKRAALEAAGVTVVNNQRDLIEAVQRALGHRTYFDPARYYAKMTRIWDAPPPVPTWGTSITRIEPNSISIRGEALQEIIGTRTLIEVTSLLVEGSYPEPDRLASLEDLAARAARAPLPALPVGPDDDISKPVAAFLLSDRSLVEFIGTDLERTVHALGRVAGWLAHLMGDGTGRAGEGPRPGSGGRRDPAALPVSVSRPESGASPESGMRAEPGPAGFTTCIGRAIAGMALDDPRRLRLVEAMVVACVDHGVTPPSAQAAILAASVRAAFEVCLASGVSAITDVHGGAGSRAAGFLLECAGRAREDGLDLEEATRRTLADRLRRGDRVEGLGHRVHAKDPRRDVLWRLAESAGVAGPCVRTSKLLESAFASVRGMSLPVNVDGVIGAIVADMGLDPRAAKALFLLGRVAGLAAHAFEEAATQLPMRRIDFARAVYRGRDPVGA